MVGLPDLPPTGAFQVWLKLVNILSCEHKAPEMVFGLVCVSLRNTYMVKLTGPYYTPLETCNLQGRASLASDDKRICFFIASKGWNLKLRTIL